MKELYTSPKAEVIEFDAKDVITTSGEVSADVNDYLLDNPSWTEFK